MSTTLRLTNSFARALSVMNLLMSNEELHNKLTGSNVYIEAYQNGREQGITIWDTRRTSGIDSTAYYVTECRNSDELVIYKGKYAMQSISEDAYSHRNSFKSIEEAVDWLVEELIATNPA